MASIKIISDPYRKKIHFQVQRGNQSEWSSIDAENNPHSELLSAKISDGFFPFVAYYIVEVLIKEYRDGSNPVSILFEGCDDEYDELLQVCAMEEFSEQVSVEQSPNYLKNARDILPDVVSTYGKIKPLVEKSIADNEQIQKDMLKFTEASNNAIPICVMGNYSSGKSTFINALIGQELLPSGAEPVTAKIYRIESSEQPDRAYIRFDYNGEATGVRFDKSGYSFLTDIAGTPLGSILIDGLECLCEADLTARVREALNIVNGYESDTEEQKISDLIQLIVPFAFSRGMQYGKYVIFDTPGSNSNSNQQHFIVLQRAMADLSNGLPIYVSEYDKLDTTDNKTLYDKIHEMKELDSTFTMIVVNKADTAQLPRGGMTPAEEAKILHESVPQNLYASGIFFVSSILGLGYKTDGEYVDDYCAEIFEEKRAKYEKPHSRFYKQLYTYDILPAQHKAAHLEAAQSCPDLLYANSGLFSAEYEIQQFGTRYSAYNKCTQARMFLDRIIAATTELIAQAKDEAEEERRELEADLDEKQKNLLAQLRETSEKLHAKYKEGYEKGTEEALQQAEAPCSVETLREYEMQFLGTRREEQGLDESRAAAREARQAIRNNLFENVASIAREKKLSALKSAASELTRDMRSSSALAQKARAARNSANQSAADDLIDQVQNDYNARTAQAQEMLESASRGYWESQCENLKKALLAIVTKTDVLSDEMKAELQETIISYHQIRFVTDEHAFDKADFKVHFALKGLFAGFFETQDDHDVLDVEKLSRAFDDRMKDAAEKLYKVIRESHENSFDSWRQGLYDLIQANIVSYSPVLRRLSEKIQRKDEEIDALTERRQKMEEYVALIVGMMAWQQTE